jgi:formate dehydrogenase gamma subunit
MADSRKEGCEEYYWRFHAFHRFLHLVMMISFTGLALTGLPLKYSQSFWARGLAALWGGVTAAGLFHRWFAGITFAYFLAHLGWLLYHRFVLKGSLLGPDSMIPTRKDLADLLQHARYFLGKGPAPRFGRFTYWEKFDYWAVFWGIAFIGLSGLLLWFTPFLSRYLPGVVFNIAYVIHSDEALLATGFIFVVHLFNTHLRPGSFPLDRSIFTGKVSAREMAERHPLEWERLQQNPGERERRRVGPDFLILFLFFFLSAGCLLPPSLSAQPASGLQPPEDEKKLCWKCHRLPNLNSTEGTRTTVALCMDCHGKKDCLKTVNNRPVSLFIDEKDYKKTVHARIACIRCHEGIATSPHRSAGMACASCHGYHGEGAAHDPHSRVACEACHSASGEAVKEPASGRVVLSNLKAGVPLPMTAHRLVDSEDEKTCLRCHVEGNRVGAPIRVLPAKSLLCIPCHSASPGSFDPVTAVALLLFAAGTATIVAGWFSGTLSGRPLSVHQKIAWIGEKAWQVFFSRKVFIFLKVFVLDILLLRRILRESLGRWTIHTLIYLPFFLRFLIGLFLFLLSKAFPMSPAVASLLDKNNPALALLYDLFGLCVIVGAAAAAARRAGKGDDRPSTAGPDVLALSLLGTIFLTGFAVEALRLHLTAVPASIGVFSFVGYPLSLAAGLLPVRWEVVYPWGWYLHAVLCGAFVAYLPFSKLFHMLTGPLVLWINAVTEEHR